MNLSEVPVPEIYKNSADFRFFIYWFSACLTHTQEDTENLIDLLDPLRCPKNLLWLLCDTQGYKYESRMPASYNRLVLLNFMKMIRNKGSYRGVMLAAALNAIQFNILDYAEEDEIYKDRVADTSLPVSSAYVTSRMNEGYIDIVYFSEEMPVDVCLEYVRPIGMYCFSHPGVRVDSKTKISVDARLANENSIGSSRGPAHIAHYRRSDYATMQRMVDNEGNPDVERRNRPYFRNADFEKRPTAMIDPGYRALYSLQIANNEHIVKSLLPSQKDPEYSVFSQGFGPQNVQTVYPDNYLDDPDVLAYNLRYDKEAEEELYHGDVTTIDDDRTTDIMNPRPAVGPSMGSMGEAIPIDPANMKYTAKDESGRIIVKDYSE